MSYDRKTELARFTAPGVLGSNSLSYSQADIEMKSERALLHTNFGSLYWLTGNWGNLFEMSAHDTLQITITYDRLKTRNHLTDGIGAQD